jgi:hypothetical protein
LNEQLYGWVGGELLGDSLAVGRWQQQRRQLILTLGTYAQRRPAGDDQTQLGTGRHQIGDGGGGLDHLLKVVQ